MQVKEFKSTGQTENNIIAMNDWLSKNENKIKIHFVTHPPLLHSQHVYYSLIWYEKE